MSHLTAVIWVTSLRQSDFLQNLYTCRSTCEDTRILTHAHRRARAVKWDTEERKGTWTRQLHIEYLLTLCFIPHRPKPLGPGVFLLPDFLLRGSSFWILPSELQRLLCRGAWLPLVFGLSLDPFCLPILFKMFSRSKRLACNKMLERSCNYTLQL